MTEFTLLILHRRKLRPEETNYPVFHSESIGVRAQTPDPGKCLSWLGRSTEEAQREVGGGWQMCKAHIRQCLLAHRPVPALSSAYLAKRL